MILSTTYFGSVEWYAQIARAEGEVCLNAGEYYVKQSSRSRCRIATANGVQTLSVPVSTGDGGKCLIRDVRISDHGNWRHQHWNAFASAYGQSPFYIYYADDLRPFYEKKWDFLFDFNLEITHKICELIGISPDIRLVEEMGQRSTFDDDRHTEQTIPEYYQVFHRRHGFTPGLSILDLLFNEGNETILKLLNI